MEGKIGEILGKGEIGGNSGARKCGRQGKQGKGGELMGDFGRDSFLVEIINYAPLRHRLERVRRGAPRRTTRSLV